MAGIGFVLRRLTRRDDLAGAVQAFTAAAAVTSGPWLLTVLAIAGSALGGDLVGGSSGYGSFRIALAYDFCFSLVLTAPATTVASRLLADQLFLGNVDEIVATFLATLATSLAVAVPVGGLFWFGYAKLPWIEAAAAFSCFAALVFLWVATTFLSVLRDFGFVLFCYALGMALACGGSLAVGRWFGTAGMLTCFATGLTVVSFAASARLFVRFPYGDLSWNKLSSAIRGNRILALIGFLVAAAPWADKWVMWFRSSGAETLANGLHDSPSYDNAMFLAYLAMVPGSAAFFVIAETGFFLSYRRFFDEILDGAGLARIEGQRRELCARVASVGFSLLLLQVLVTIVIELMAPALARSGILSLTQFSIFRIGVLGVQFHLLLNCLLVIMSYLDLRADQIAIAGVFLFLNAAMTIGLLPFGSAVDGYGYFLASLISFLFAAFLVAWRCRDLIFIAFIRNNASIRNVY